MNTKLKCLLIDDELPGLTYLKMLCEQIPELEIVKTFNDPEKLMREIPSLDFDLCITDIEMPGIDGLNLAGMLKGKMIIFITAYKHYAVDAFDIDAVDYITKPVKKERLEKAISKALEKLDRKTETKNSMQINTDKGKAILYFDTIVYIKTATIDSRDKEVLLEDGSFLVLKNINFNTLLEELPDVDFCRVNKKEIIALKRVNFFSHNEITLSERDLNDKKITFSLSETYRSDFLLKVKI
ncbi:DNA-binding LytR/AlgR family response regulator [Flavobacterium arsenatis]|uniref:DNA-binding LytR/AlgR family response regulator n=1 Tax=Flavobacterium arsenatis TaxID=1484332 RepID=A0ABU1TKV9_9FLAO|nr:response regulator [Flavobacterium arsenatis]MDR6966619.1 DNA-binding LytR/AlgR family response regulator [Flavobacterium arsenatis]